MRGCSAVMSDSLFFFDIAVVFWGCGLQRMSVLWYGEFAFRQSQPENFVFVCLGTRLSLSFDKIGCGSAELT